MLCSDEIASLHTYPLLTVAEMRQIEAEANASGLSYAQMMQNAGRAAAEIIDSELAKANPLSSRCEPVNVLLLIGPGNNGGDGLVCGAALREKRPERYKVTAALLRPRDEQAPPYAQAVQQGVTCFVLEGESWRARLHEALDEANVVVDALLGTGIARPIEGTLREVLRLVAEWRGRNRAGKLFALDGITGMNYDTGALDLAAVPADVTVTFHAPKRGHFCFPAAGARGKLYIASIGISQPSAQPSAVLVGEDWVSERLPMRPPDANKGTFGRVLVIGGCAAYVGAPTLAARAAYRVGAGLVALAVPNTIKLAVAALCPEATFIPLPITEDAHTLHSLLPITTWLAHAPATVVLGPGLGQAAPTRDFLRGVLDALRAQPPCGLVVDADALNLLAGEAEWHTLLPPNSVLTPHPGEMARLMGSTVEAVQSDRIGVALEAAQRWGHVVVLKGAHTVIASPKGEAGVLPFANAALAVAGVGDVLAGCVGGLLAQGQSPFVAAVCGAFTHGAAGDTWRSKHGQAGLLARDLLDLLPEALHRLSANAAALPLIHITQELNL
ncbi:MAG: NAD(P)H-hydrate dehydratase [Anaerolineae bacterium]|nr:NAD(P)H-hydrate dehydratase [Thermoflexales bacterium]MDW8395343.1 NAD(P)H-hydrate dehydratase [Anaerolineae bacterium]